MLRLVTFVVTSLIALFYSISFEKASRSARVTDPRTNVTYQGISNGRIDTFLNIPFGQDTSGAGRFAPPKPFIPARNSTFNATAIGPACPQQLVPFPGLSGLVSNVMNISEDCLNLRITRPSFTHKRAKLPVMVYIYGGGYTIGQIYDDFYTPDQLVLDSISTGTPVIYVAMNYRVGIFGFTTSELLRRKKSLNVGLRDQRLALEWVQENIQIFGGDPDQVTIFGESAGGTSAALQMSAFGGRKEKLFHQAIIQSGAIGAGIATDFIDDSVVDVVSTSGCNFHHPESEISLDCLRSLPLETLLEIEIAAGRRNSPLANGFSAFAPIVDGDFIPDAPSELFQTGRFTRVPLIIGWNVDDGSFFTPPTVKSDQDVMDFLLSNYPGLTPPTIEKIFELYPLSDFDPIPLANVSAQFTRASRIERDIQFTCPSLFVAGQVARYRSISPAESTYHPESQPGDYFSEIVLDYARPVQKYLGHHLKPSHQVFVYELNQTVLAALLSAQGFPQLGISHVADIPYVFDEVARFNASESDRLLARQVTGSWSRFAATGLPSSRKRTSIQGWEQSLKSWGRSWLEDMRVMVIGGGRPGMSGLDEGNDALVNERLVERCGFFFDEKIIRQIGT